MLTSAEAIRKRPVNLSLNEVLVNQARAYTHNLSATIEALLGEFVLTKEKEQRQRQARADACAEDWNALHDTLGSFADEHASL